MFAYDQSPIIQQCPPLSQALNPYASAQMQSPARVANLVVVRHSAGPPHPLAIQKRRPHISDGPKLGSRSPNVPSGLACGFPRLCRPLVLMMLARVLHHFEADLQLHVARRPTHIHRSHALRSFGGRYFRPIFLQVFARPLLSCHAAFDRSPFAATGKGYGCTTCGPHIVSRNRVGHMNH